MNKQIIAYSRTADKFYCLPSVADPGSGAFLPLDPGSSTHISESPVTIFWAKNNIMLCQSAQIFFLYLFKNKIVSIL
jgi:hypothetical protein